MDSLFELDKIRVINTAGHFIGKYGDEYWLFLLDTPPLSTSVEDYHNWYKDCVVQLFSIHNTCLPQYARLTSIEDLEPLSKWSEFSGLNAYIADRFNDRLHHSPDGIWEKIFTAWKAIRPEGSFRYVWTMRDVIMGEWTIAAVEEAIGLED